MAWDSMVTFTRKHTLTPLPVGIPWKSYQKASKTCREGSLCGSPWVCSDTTSATGKLEWYRHSWEIQSLCNVPGLFLRNWPSKNTSPPTCAGLQSFLALKKTLQTLYPDPQNQCICLESERRDHQRWFHHLVWFWSSGGETNQPRWVKRNGDRNLPQWRERSKSQWKSLEAAKEVQAFLSFSEDLLPSEKYWGTEHTY